MSVINMQDRPTSVELLEAAADFVDSELVPAVQGARQFQARVVANVMRVVAREIKLEDPLVRSEVKALAHLLGHEKPHLHSLNRESPLPRNRHSYSQLQKGDLTNA